jgi:hypothetical protein
MATVARASSRAVSGAVQGLQPAGRLLRLRSLLGEAAAQGQPGTVKPPGGVYPGSQAEGQVGAGGGSIDSRPLGQSAQPQRCSLPPRGEALAHQPPVLILEWHHVRHGAQRHQRQLVRGGPWGHGAGRLQGAHQLVGDPDSRQPLEGIAIVGPLGIDQRVGRGQLDHRGAVLAVGKVVIRDDQPQPGGTLPDHIHRGGAAVHSDHQPGSPAPQLNQRLPVEPIALGLALWDVRDRLDAGRLQRADQQSTGTDTICVVVAVHGDRLPRPDGLTDQADRLVHVREQLGIVLLTGGARGRPGQRWSRSSGPGHPLERRSGTAQLRRGEHPLPGGALQLIPGPCSRTVRREASPRLDSSQRA